MTETDTKPMTLEEVKAVTSRIKEAIPLLTSGFYSIYSSHSRALEQGALIDLAALAHQLASVMEENEKLKVGLQENLIRIITYRAPRGWQGFMLVSPCGRTREVEIYEPGAADDPLHTFTILDQARKEFRQALGASND